MTAIRRRRSPPRLPLSFGRSLQILGLVAVLPVVVFLSNPSGRSGVLPDGVKGADVVEKKEEVLVDQKANDKSPSEDQVLPDPATTSDERPAPDPDPAATADDKVPPVLVTGAMTVDVELGLYNSKGYTARQLVDGLTPDESSFTYKGFLEAALGFIWKDKYGETSPLSRRHLLGKGVGYETGGEVDTVETAALRGDGGEKRGVGSNVRRRLSTRLNIKLVNQTITSGVDVECPDNVPNTTVSGALNKCQNVTATFAVEVDNLDQREVRHDIVATFAAAQTDGTLSQKYNDIDARRIWRVQNSPQGTYISPSG